MLSKANRLPLYYQLKSELGRSIDAGRWKPGAQLPSERELCERYNISRITVRQAISELVNEGRLTREQGKGTFVASPRIEQRLTALTGFTQDMRARGNRPGAKVLQLTRTEPSLKVAQALGAVGRRVVLLKRLRLSNGEPVAIETAHLFFDQCDKLLGRDLEDASLYGLLLAQFGIVPARAEQQLNATACPAAEAKLLGVKVGSPTLHIVRTTYDQDDRPFELVESYYRGDKYMFRAELQSEALGEKPNGVHATV